MRAAVHHLRESNLPALTPNASAEAQVSGQLGSAERTTSQRALGQLHSSRKAEKARADEKGTEDGTLSLSALRLQERGWQGLSKALGDIKAQQVSEDVAQDSTGTPKDVPMQTESDAETTTKTFTVTLGAQAERLSSRLTSMDGRLIDALLTTGIGSVAQVSGDIAEKAKSRSSRHASAGANASTKVPSA